MAGEGGDRTEAATPRRLQSAREQGQVPLSREVPALAGLGAVTLLLGLMGPSLAHGLIERLVPMLTLQGPVDVPHALASAVMAAGFVALPIVLGVMAAGVAGTLLQGGLALSPAAILPDLSRLSPMRGLKRLIGLRSAVEAAKSIVKVAVLGWIAMHVVRQNLPALRNAPDWTSGQLVDRMVAEVMQLLFTLLAAQTVIAGADIAWTRFRHGQDLRMTKQEVKDDAKETNGNPMIKARMRRIRAMRARSRMMAAVPKATVVVTNPTHYAIALAYDRGQGGAPRVVAKGVDEVAARIREMAREHRVPLVANPPLARALFTVDLDAEIPAEHFKVVAEIIAYVWRLQNRAVAR